MATPTAWQLGEDLWGKLFPLLRDMKQLKGKLELEISHKHDEMEFGSITTRKSNNPTPEDPAKMRKLGENVTRIITEAVQQYEYLCMMEANKSGE